MRRKILPIAAFIFFDAWLLSFAYEGQILYTLFDSYAMSPARFVPWAILAHAAGLLSCGFAVKTIAAARRCLFFASALCSAGSSVFFFPPTPLWPISLITVSFLAGFWNASWGFFYRACSLPGKRQSAVAAAITGSTTLMAGLNLVASHGYPRLGLALSLLFLLVSLLCTRRLPVLEQRVAGPRMALGRPGVLLGLFIVTITISAGLMFQVVNPAFAHHTELTSWYWALPYITAVILVAALPPKVNRSHVLHASLAMIGFGFLAFMVLDRSAGSYLVVNTLLLGAFGITDLFWWGILGEMLEYRGNAARLLGAGLSINVAGVLLGELLSPLAVDSKLKNLPTYLSFAAVFTAIVVLPILYEKLSQFIPARQDPPPVGLQVPEASIIIAAGLTRRETEILQLLLKGYTYRLIERELFISTGTVKTHVQNIFRKLGVHNRTGLVEMLVKKQNLRDSTREQF